MNNKFNMDKINSESLFKKTRGEKDPVAEMPELFSFMGRRKTSRFSRHPNTTQVNHRVNTNPSPVIQGSPGQISRNIPSSSIRSTIDKNPRLNPVTQQTGSGGFHRVNPNTDYMNQRYEQSENVRSVYLSYIERDYNMAKDKEDQDMYRMWIQEAKTLSKEDFLEQFRKSLQYQQYYLFKLSKYFSDQYLRYKEQWKRSSSEYSYYAQRNTSKIEELTRNINIISEQNKKLSEENRKLREVNKSLRKDTTKRDREWEEEKKMVYNRMKAVSSSKKNLVSSFANIINEIQESHMNGISVKKEESMKSIRNWATKMKESRGGVSKNLKFFREEIERMIEKEKKSVGGFTTKLSNILDHQDQKILNSIKDKVFEKLAKSMDISINDRRKKN